MHVTCSDGALRVMTDALGGEVDAATYELSYDASAADVASALEAVSNTLGTVDVTRTISGTLICEEESRVRTRVA